MLVNLSLNLLGALIFLFIFWKHLKEDYAHEIIFKSALYILLGILLASAIALKFARPWFLWLEFSGAVAGVMFSLLTLKTRFYETFESLVIATLPWVALIFLGDSVARSSLSSFLGFVTTLFLILVYYYFNAHYKKFTWYRSGKIGFAGLATAGIVFFIRAGLAVFTSGVLSFVDKYEAIVSGTLAFVCFLTLFNLGKKV